MDKQRLKDKLKAQLKSLAYRAITTVILVITAIITVWVYAAFTEPLAGPNDSDQDFLQNILGANNADNDFDSSSVAANVDGSIIERQEYIADKVGPLISSTDCSTAGWTWDSSQGICASPKMYVTSRTTWNSCGTTSEADNATCPDTLDNPTYQANGSTVYLPQYTCIITASTDTLVERMTAFKNFAGGTADVTTWGGLIQMGNREIDNVQHKNWSALAVADCVDGVKDLGKYYHPIEGCAANLVNCNDYSYYGEYNTRNNMLAGWAGASGSHLPTPAEYKTACLNLLGSTGWPATDVGEGVHLWSAAVGNYNGSNWSQHARTGVQQLWLSDHQRLGRSAQLLPRVFASLSRIGHLVI